VDAPAGVAGRCRTVTAPGSFPAVTTRAEYPHLLAIPTRWDDNDVYGHVNNVRYYAFFDTVINTFLIREGGLDILEGDAIGLCAESHCAFTAPLAFPETVEAGLRVGRLGTSSVRYEIALFGAGEAPAGTGWFVHVFVDRAARRPVPIPPGIRSALERLVVPRQEQEEAA
jgi:acyl-CoA thioester hydrolase